jgi:hypothetical protein
VALTNCRYNYTHFLNSHLVMFEHLKFRYKVLVYFTNFYISSLIKLPLNSIEVMAFVK